MWEVEIVSKDTNKRIINYIYKMMKSYVQDKSCVLTTFESDDEYKILFACAINKKDYYLEMIKLCIIDYIINVYKYEYLIKNIENFMKDDVTFKSFIKLLSLYDKASDEKALKKSIQIENCFYIDSFLKFRMAPLVNHWKELCMLAVENFDYFLSNDTFMDLMRFLIATMDEACEKIKIIERDGKYSIYNIAKNCDMAELVEECSTPFSLISTVLKICPKFIDVYASNNMDTAVKFLTNVYDDRINIIKEK